MDVFVKLKHQARRWPPGTSLDGLLKDYLDNLQGVDIEPIHITCGKELMRCADLRPNIGIVGYVNFCTQVGEILDGIEELYRGRGMLIPESWYR